MRHLFWDARKVSTSFLTGDTYLADEGFVYNLVCAHGRIIRKISDSTFPDHSNVSYLLGIFSNLMGKGINRIESVHPPTHPPPF